LSPSGDAGTTATLSSSTRALRKAITGHFAAAEAASDDDEIVVSNKYFTASVVFKDVIVAAAANADDGEASEEEDEKTPEAAAAATEETAATTKEDGIILVFDDDDRRRRTTAHRSTSSTPPPPVWSAAPMTTTSFDSLDSVHEAVERSGAAGDLLRMCVGVRYGGTRSGGGNGDDARDEKEYSRRVLWCLDRGYEYCEVDLSSEGQRRGHDERDKEGFARVVEALRGTVWSSAVMNRQRKQQLTQSYDETKAKTTKTTTAAVKAAQPNDRDERGTKSDDNDTDEEDPRPAYEPPDPSLFRQQIMAEVSIGVSETDAQQEKEREAAARRAVLEQSGIGGDDDVGVAVETSPAASGRGQENVDPDKHEENVDDEEEEEGDEERQQRIRRRREELEQERLFDDFEGALRQARSIREVSRSGSLTDDERRKRAGDAAVMLMDLMGKMGFDDSDEEGGGESGSEEQAVAEQEEN